MSDELTIQGVNPQAYQPQKTSTTPYTVGGAVVGGLAGAGINSWVKKPMSWEDVVKEAKDTTDFSTKAEPASWEAVKKDAQNVADLEAKLKNVPEKTLTSGEEFERLEGAKKLRDAEFERLVEIERKKASTGTVTTLPTAEEMRLGIKGDDASKVAADYKKYNETLKPEYDAKVNAVKINPATAGHSEYIKAETAKNNFETKLKQYYEDTAKNAAEKDKATRKNTEARLEKELKKLVNNEYKYKTNNEILEQAFKDGNMVEQKGWRKKLTTNVYTDPKSGKKYVLKEDIKFSDLKKEANTSIDNLRNNLLDDIKGAENGYNEASKNISEFAKKKEFRPLSKKGHKNTEFVCDLSDIKGKNTISELEREAKIIEKLADPKKASKVKPADISAIQTKYGLNPKEVAGNKKIAEQISKRLDLAKEYKDLDKALKDSLGGQDRIALYKDEMDKAINSNNDVKSAAKKIKTLAKKYGINVETATDIDESAIKNKVTEAMKGSSFEDKVKSAQEAFDKALESKGTANTAAKEAIEKELAAAKGKLQQSAEALGNKFKKGGTNKWVAAGIGTVIGAAALYGIAASKNKKAV